MKPYPDEFSLRPVTIQHPRLGLFHFNPFLQRLRFRCVSLMTVAAADEPLVCGSCARTLLQLSCVHLAAPLRRRGT